jgi:hypothetical protein
VKINWKQQVARAVPRVVCAVTCVTRGIITQALEQQNMQRSSAQKCRPPPPAPSCSCAFSPLSPLRYQRAKRLLQVRAVAACSAACCLGPPPRCLTARSAARGQAKGAAAGARGECNHNIVTTQHLLHHSLGCAAHAARRQVDVQYVGYKEQFPGKGQHVRCDWREFGANVTLLLRCCCCCHV